MTDELRRLAGLLSAAERLAHDSAGRTPAGIFGDLTDAAGLAELVDTVSRSAAADLRAVIGHLHAMERATGTDGTDGA